MTITDAGVLITGASQGLGAALARELGRKGARLALVARGAEALERVAAEIRAAGGVAHALPGNVGAKGDIHRLAGAAQALLGNVDVLIHNASTLGPVPLRPLLDTACEDLEQVLQVNLVGPFRLSKAVAGGMALRGRGLVVHITSDAAQVPYPGWGAYGVSKVALEHLGRIWAEELSARGVHFLAVDPGEMNTRMHADAIPEADPRSLADPAGVAARVVELLARSGSGAEWRVAP